MVRNVEVATGQTLAEAVALHGLDKSLQARIRDISG
jgi:hypothetical protein